MRGFACFAVLGLLISGLLVPATAAGNQDRSGHQGVWRAIQCAQWESDGPLDLHCEIWGDGSLLQMTIGPGERPQMLFIDFSSAYCSDIGAPTDVRIARGIGTYEEGQLTFDVLAGGCGPIPVEGYSEGSFYWDPGSDSLWSHDPEGDGYGLHWWRVGG